MGLLSKGTPLDWEDAKKVADHVRTHGIQQFLTIYRRLKDRRNDNLLWGDEVRRARKGESGREGEREGEKDWTEEKDGTEGKDGTGE